MDAVLDSDLPAPETVIMRARALVGNGCGILSVRGLQDISVQFADGLPGLLRSHSRFSSARERRRQNTKIAARTRPRPQIRAGDASQLLPRASLRQPR